jgi:glycosyltransferase involved in cell wall biosynthesis
MKIAYIITSLELGGAETITLNIANKFIEKGHNVIIIYLTGEIAKEHNIHPSITLFPLRMKKNFRDFYKALSMTKNILDDFKPDVVHGNMFHANLFIRLLRPFSSSIPRLISTEHSNNIESNLRMVLYRLTDSLSDVNTNVSAFATNHFIEKKAFSKEKSITVYNGIDLDRFIPNFEKRATIRSILSIKDDDFLFINVGRLSPAKDQSTLLKAFKIVSENYENAKLIILGDGELKHSLEHEKIKLGLINKVFFIGSRSNVEDYYNASDCFVLSSEWEGFGIVLAEAMACKLPVIATESGGCLEVVNNKDFIVPIKNPSLLSRKMLEICKMSTYQRLQLGEQNKKQASNFDINKIINIWSKLYFN